MLLNRILVVLLLLASFSLNGQKLLQLERGGSLKTIRYYIGDEITFQLWNDDVGWYNRVILDIDVDRNLIVFENHALPIDSISMIQLDRSKAWQVFGTALQYGGVGMAASSLAWSAVESRPVDWTGIGTSLACSAVGTGMKYAMRKKKFKIGKRKRLRLLDLNFGPPVPADKT